MTANPDRFRRIEEAFHEALEVPEDERRQLIQVRADGDEAFAAEVSALVAAHTGRHVLLDAPDVKELPPGMRAGPYALDRVLGAGGMATVYLAHRVDRQFEKQVAVKLVNRGLAAEIAGDRFQTERRILAQLEHPNIARLLDAGLTEFGQPYLVMEWVDGVTLDAWVEREQPPLDRRLDLWLDIAGAVGYAHRNLVIHRDLKPSNVLVGRDGVAKLVDFGIAKLIAEGRGQEAATETLRLTPLYASPEQLRGQAVTTAADVYGLGLLLCELATGAHPFRRPGLSPHEQAQASLAEEPAIAPGTPPDLAAIIGMALRKEPDRRYATTAELAEDVRRFRRGQPVAAQPDSVGYRARRFVARHRLAVGAAAVAILSLVTLTALAIWQAQVASAQRSRAEEITEYITGFLGTTPTGSDWALRDRGAGLRVVELADLMADRLDGSSSTHPETEAALRYVLASVYFQVGQIRQAERHAQRAVELFDGIAPDDPQRLGAVLVLAAADNAAGRFADAERRVLEIRSRWSDPPPSAVAGMSEQLGIAQWRLGRLDEAEQTLGGALDSLRTVLDEHDRNVGMLRTNLALVHLERGDFSRAADELEQAVAISRADAAHTSLPLGWALVNLANTYRFMGRTDDVLRVAAEAYERMREALGDGHFSLIHSLAFIAYAKAIRGEADAEAVIRRGLAVQAQLPDDHYERAVGLTFLGFVLMKNQKLPEARQALEEALRLRRAAFAAPNWRIAETAGFLGETLALAGSRDQALALLDESVGTFTTLYGPDNPRTLEAVARRRQYAPSMEGGGGDGGRTHGGTK